MMGFDNATIKAPRRTKPHICKREGWWRVSKYNGWAYIWNAAHVFINARNSADRDQFVRDRRNAKH